MDDYLSEQEQWEQVKAWVREGWPWFAGAVLVIAGGWQGWKAWQAHRDNGFVAAASEYEQLIRAIEANDEAKASSLADALAADHAGSGYSEQGQLALARLMVERNELPAALDRLQKALATTRDAELRPLLRLRIARVQLQQQQPDAALATLDAAGADLGAYAPRYAELRGDVLLAKGDRSGALKAYREAQAAGGSASGDLLALKIGELTRS